jgi:hypothetical protein
MKTKTQPKKGAGVRGNSDTRKSSNKSTKATKTSSGTTRADYEDEDAAIERASK